VAKIVCIQNSGPVPSYLDPALETIVVSSVAEAVRILESEAIEGVLIVDPEERNLSAISALAPNIFFHQLPNGIAILDQQFRIVEANENFRNWLGGDAIIGRDFLETLGNPGLASSDPYPLQTVISSKLALMAMVEFAEKHFRMHLTPILDSRGNCLKLLVSLNDCTESVHERQKLEALHKAGVALADLRPEEISEMDVEQRIELLKDNILFYTRDLLKFDVVEIRLLKESGELVPLLSEGINAERAKFPIFAETTENGVTGFVGATGESYLCEDTTDDPLYLGGLIGARSSLTVPLIYHNEVVGTFNVESPKINAFSDSDLRFLETFASDIAVALNTLDLLTAQQSNTAQQSVSAIFAGVALPIDEILNDTVHTIEAYMGTNQEVIQRLQDILRNAREIKRVIQRVGVQLVSSGRAVAAGDERPALNEKRILVVDADADIRSSAHQMLEKYGCVVETAQSGHEALLLIRNSGLTNAYDAIIADIRLPDIKGYEFYQKLKDFSEDPPLILMSGFGWDPGHSIVKAREAGLRANSVVFKPFRLKQLLDTLEAVIGNSVPQ
jgi:CheY-like chemotaxis protein